MNPRLEAAAPKSLKDHAQPATTSSSSSSSSTTTTTTSDRVDPTRFDG